MRVKRKIIEARAEVQSAASSQAGQKDVAVVTITLELLYMLLWMGKVT